MQDLIRVQDRLNNLKTNRQRIREIQAEVLARRELLDAQVVELRNRISSAGTALRNEIRVQKERVRLLEDEVVARRNAQIQINDVNANRIRLARRDVESAKQAQTNLVQSAQFIEQTVVSSARERSRATVQAAEESIKASKAEVRQMELEAKAADKLEQAKIKAAEKRINALKRDRTAKGTISKRTAAKIETESEQLQVLRDATAANQIERAERLKTARQAQTLIEQTKNAEIRASQETLARFEASEKAKIDLIRAKAQAQIDFNKRELQGAIEAGRRGDSNAARRVREAQENLRLGRRTQEDQIARVRAQGRQLIAEAGREVNATRLVINALNRKAQALRAVIQQQRIYERAIARIRDANRALFGGISSLVTRLSALALAFGGFRGFVGLIRSGIEFNAVMETARLGIAALITAEANLRTEDGKLLKGQEALSAAFGLSEDQLRKLRIAGIRTSATTQELVTSFQEAVGAGISVGLTLDQIRKFTVSVAQAATQIHLPFNQLNQEVRSILQGTIDRNSRIAKSLGLTNQMVAQAREEGRLYQLLVERFEAFNVAGEESINTWRTLGSNIKDAISLLSGEVTQPFFQQVRDAGVEALGEIFDINSATIKEGFRGIVTGFSDFFDEMGSAFADGIRSVISGAKELSIWLEKNRESVHATVVAFGTMVREIAGFISDLIVGARNTAQMATAGGELAAIFRTVAGLFQALRENIEIVKSTLVGMAATGLVAVAIANPIAAALLTLAGIIGFLNRAEAAAAAARGEADRGNAAYARQTVELIRLGEQYIALRKKMEDFKEGSQERKDAELELVELRSRLLENDKTYAETLNNTTLSAEEQAEAIRNLAKARQEMLRKSLETADAQVRKGREVLAQLEAEKLALQAQSEQLTGRKRDESAITKKNQQIEAIKQQLAAAENTAEVVREGLRQIGTAAEEARKQLQTVTIDPKSHGQVNQKILNDEVQAARARLKTAQQEFDTLEELSADSFEARQISAAQYYNTLESEALRVLQVEKDVADAELALARARGDQGEIDAAKEHQERVSTAELEIQFKYGRLKAKAARDFAKTRQDIEIQALELGDADERLLAAAKKAEAEFRDALRQAFAERDFGTVIEINKIIDIRNAEAQFKELQTKMGNAADGMSRSIEQVRAQFEAGLIDENQAAQQMAEIWGRQAALIRDVIAAAEALEPKLRQSPEFVTFLAEANQELIDLERNIKLALDPLTQLKAGFRASVQTNLTDFLMELGDATRTAGGLFKQFAKGVIDDMRRLIAQALAFRIVSAIFRSFGAVTTGDPIGGIFGGGGLGGYMGGQVAKLARRAPRKATGGGLLEGPGTPTSDSIPLLWVSRKEYIQPAVAMDFYGAAGLRFMEMFRRRMLPKNYIQMAVSGMNRLPVISRQEHNYRALGGSIADVKSAVSRPMTPMAFDVDSRVSLDVTVDQNGLLRVMQGKTGKRVVLAHVGTSPRYLRDQVFKRMKRGSN